MIYSQNYPKNKGGDIMGDSIQLLNAIRGSIGGDYAGRIPEATRDNIATVGNTILNYQAHTNSFFTTLLNRISKTVIKHVDEMEDIYAVFRGEELPYGDTIQKIFIDIVESSAFEGVDTSNPASFITPNKGVIHVEYTSVDRKLFYKVSVSVAELKEAFLTADKLDEFITQLVASMTRSYAIDVYVMTSNLLRTHSSYVLGGVENGGTDDSSTTISADDMNLNALIVPSTVASYNPTTGKIEWETTGAKEFLKLLRKTSRSLRFYHKLDYGNVADDSDALSELENVKTIKAVKTPIENQVVALEVDTMAEIDVDALAVLFNMEKAEVKTRQIELENGVLGYPVAVDGTEEESPAYYIGGFICDKDAVERVKSYEDSESFKNPEHLFVNYWQHHWGAMAVSKFCDFVPIVFNVQTEGD